MIAKKTLMLFLALALGLPAAAQKLVPVSGEVRQKDRDAIRAHIVSIFEAYMHKDRAKIVATHSQQWRGFLTPSREIIRGIDEYMQYADRNLKGNVFQDYKILDFDVMFYNDVALVPYIARLGDEQSKVKLRVLDVYAKLNGDWIQVGSYTAPHPDTQAYFQEQLIQLPPPAKQQLMEAREAVWRDFFTNNHARLAETIPSETIGINPSQKEWDGREQVLAGAKAFVDGGGKLTRLEFPHTDIQVYGNVALMYSKYVYETESAGKSETHSGRATEMFVNRDGKWVNVGWHMDSEQ